MRSPSKGLIYHAFRCVRICTGAPYFVTARVVVGPPGVEPPSTNHRPVCAPRPADPRPQLPSADDVQYWKSPDKAGWLQCQGEHLRNWRNRWFVLKQGYLFRFYNDKVSESVKPRGVVDLSKIQDVKVLPGRSNTIQLKTSTGGVVAYIASTETEVVEWVSAIEGAMQKIAKHVAGVEDEPPAAAAAGGRSKGGSSAAGATAGASGNAANPAEWLRQLERNFQSNAGGSGSGGSGDNHHRAGGGHHGRSNGTASSNLGSTMVSVVGYDSFGAGGGGGGGGSSTSSHGQGQGQQYGGYQARDNSPYAALNRQYSGGYAPIQGGCWWACVVVGWCRAEAPQSTGRKSMGAECKGKDRGAP